MKLQNVEKMKSVDNKKIINFSKNQFRQSNSETSKPNCLCNFCIIPA